MSSVIIYAGLLTLGCVSLAFPWLGVVGSYFVGILNPQAIWWWNFESLRPVYFIMLPTLVGVILLSLRKGMDWGAVLNRRMVCLYVIWIMGMVSALLSPLPPGIVVSEIRNPAYFMEILSKIILLVILGSLTIRTGVHVRYLTLALVVPALYLTYWINHRYLSGAVWGRVGGPVAPGGSGIYRDENVFSVLFVVVTPFLWYAGLYAKQFPVKLVWWAAMLFAWHGIFLTGSRGGLIALGAVLFTIAVRQKSKMLSIALVLAFSVAFVWQAGDTMKERFFSINEYTEDASATGRLDAWGVGLDMLKANPVAGVGPGAFLRKFPEYSDRKPLQAHNTFVQFAAEFGMIASIAFAYLLWTCFSGLRKAQRTFSEWKEGRERDLWTQFVDSTLPAVVGVTVAAAFLSLQLFEALYFLVLLSNIVIVKSTLEKTGDTLV